MSRNGSRWYTFSRVTPLADGKIVAILPGTEYEVYGWSRTQEAALAKRAKLDRAGRQGINIFAASLQQAMADVMECYAGVVVKGYISPANRRAGRAIVKAAVMRTIFCPFTGKVLDMRRALVFSTTTSTFICSAEHWDSLAEESRAYMAARPGITIYDGRELFKR